MPTETSKIEIVFSERAAGSPDLLFVEVEDGQGNSINIGDWSQRDGYHVLTIDLDLPAEVIRAVNAWRLIPATLRDFENITVAEVAAIHRAAHPEAV